MVDIDWAASNPGDWTRLITAYSPGGEPIPEPATMLLLGSGLVGLAGFGKSLERDNHHQSADIKGRKKSVIMLISVLDDNCFVSA